MKIAINCIFFQPKGGGIKEYIYNLVSNILKVDTKNEYIFYLSKDMFIFFTQHIHLTNKAKVKLTPYSSKQVIRRSIFEQNFWRKEEDIEKFDIFHSPFFYSPKFKYAKIIITVHDLRFCSMPETYTKLRAQFLKYKVPKSLKDCSRIISISEFTKDEIIKYYHVEKDKIQVVHEAINRDSFSEKNIDLSKLDNNVVQLLQKKRFILTTGHVEPRKNYVRLAKAFKEVIKSPHFSNLCLVVVGKKSQGYNEFIEEIKDCSKILYLDFVSRSTLLWLYKNAQAFIFPSIYEGFGFPPLEASAMGTISTVSNSSCIPEICGDSVLYFDPYNIEDITTCIERILTDDTLKSNLQIKAKDNLNRFSWEKNALQTLNIYNNIYNR